MTYETFDYSQIRIDAEAYEKNRTRQSQINNKDRDDCFICGRPVNSKVGRYVHLRIDGVLIPKDAEELPEYEGGMSQGCFPIGSECAKKLPKKYVLTLDRLP